MLRKREKYDHSRFSGGDTVPRAERGDDEKGDEITLKNGGKGDESTLKEDEIILKNLYKDPKFGLLSASKFVIKVKSMHPEIKTDQIRDFMSRQIVQQTTQKGKFFGYFKTVAPAGSVQMDLFFMDKYKSKN